MERRVQRSALLAALLWTTPFLVQAAEIPISFSREIRPILSNNCFACHGPDEKQRKAKLRLDTRDGAFKVVDGTAPVVPGHPEKSEIFRRVTAADPEDRMPPADSGKELSASDIEKLRLWIQQGAPWEEHWAFTAPVRPELPDVEDESWPINPIDYFVLKRLEQENLRPAPQADKTDLIRRVTLGLTGLPPTIPEIEAFLADSSAKAYEKLVDRLLRSPRYGEHMARFWLDAARYGDTHGLHLDNERSIWPYRDWVVRAFNCNMPFDQFTIEQLAGDLLPNPTRDQLVATGFNRCNVTTSEGGAIPEEFAARYAVDRVETMSTVWMGLTAGCAVCHDHKFDPISQKEFYSLYAFFNNLDENPMDGNALLPPPVVKLATPEQEAQLARFDQRLATLDRAIKAAVDAIELKEPADEADIEPTPQTFVWIDDRLPSGAKPSDGKAAWNFVDRSKAPVHSGEKSVKAAAEQFSQILFTDAKEKLLVGKGDKIFAYVYIDPADPPKEIMIQFNDGNWNHRAFWGEDLIDFGRKDSPERRYQGPVPEAGKFVRLEIDAADVGLQPGAEIHGLSFSQYGGTLYWDNAGIVSKLPQGNKGFESLAAWLAFQREVEKPRLPKPVLEAIKAESSERTEEQTKTIRDYFVEHVYSETRMVFDPLHEQQARLRRERDEFDRTITRTLITKELPEPRPTYVLKRGEYDKKGEQVFANVPAVLPPFPSDAPTNRLGLALWLVDPAHPLTARVMVNRIWQQHFGTGIVKTSEDFGSQGEPPSHPELLDWLATEFIASGWDIKHIHRLILHSATYRQSSRLTPELAEKDPENRLLARGPRFRLDAETIRDTTLAISGLLVEKVGGRGVHPYQPPGIWEAVAYPTSNTARYKQDDGDALYRRSLYTFWKRTAPPASMSVFDAPTRESCRVRRERTNTPLQALALMNDVQYIEAARHLARRIFEEGGQTDAERLAYGFRLATARFPDEKELSILTDLYYNNRAEYQKDCEAAAQLLQVGDSEPGDCAPAPDWAAMTIVANTLLNLSETISQK